MGQQQSKGELLYQQVSYGNSEGIRTLRRDGADLEWMDREGKTPLILACMNSELYDVAKTLIELGSNVNAYRPGRHAGTPLHHAAKRGLENTVKLLLSHGANPLILNDDCQTPLEVARVKGFSNVVRAIESHICLFSGWMREFYGPTFLDLFAPQLLSRRVWAVIVPTGSRNASKPFKLELVVYASLQDAQPRTVMPLWKANLEEPKGKQSDTSVMIVDNSTKTRLKLAPSTEGDTQQLKWFCDACKGIPQPMHPPVFLQTEPSAPPPPSEDELAMAMNASLHTTTSDPSNLSHHSINQASSSSGPSSSIAPPPRSGKASAFDYNSHGIGIVLESSPSAPPLTDDDIATVAEGPVHYPSIDSTPVDVPSASSLPATTDGERKEDGSTGTCAICLDAPSEAVCVPCGHVAGCMSCLNEVKSKKWGCPVCRAKIDQVIKLYRV
ncbi:PREDICTED: putative E3 ubiquitin-protein ligase XBAT35 isoform X2 [Camelina sativa]|uniref:E3 ubiquitin-protein ligase XBAT35 isoform X2 n=1 Tax=Camelina sativa TaxID=90675 RepID=A0ABM0Z9D3_CAMSA|nr:PREDICTED: putative E3 ubiquitin-protein ligase XBAT35 isoform X2 [Camelina sativa]